MKNRAFTLLELLVVITIIGILSSIVIVSMSGSTDSATIAKGKAYAQQVHALLGANAVGVWNFDEGTGTTLTDISGYGNDGTLNKGANGTGLDWVASDIEGTALQFDGVDDYVDCGNGVSLRSYPLTLEAWIKTTDSGANKGIINKYISGSGNGYQIYIGGGRLKAWYFKDFSNYTRQDADVADGGLINNGNWHHIIYTVDSDGGKMYVDSVLKNTKVWTGTAGISTETTPIKIGYYTSYFNGLIDEIRIYAEALPSTEIQKHYVQGLERFLANQTITQVEYDQRMEEFNQYLASNRF